MAALSDALAGVALDLVVCPELFTSGYHIGRSHADLAEPVDGPVAVGIAALAQRSGTAIVYGYPEAAEGVVFNSAALICPKDGLLANHRKRLASPGSFEEETFANGPEPTFAEFGGLRLAIAICYEIEFPETARQAALGGAGLLVVPTALVDQWGVVAEKIVPARAFENGLWLAYANHAGEEGGYTYLGGSRIVAPDGHEVAVAGAGQSLICAEIDPGGNATARARLPYLRDCVKL
jgi:predicted amidohydrolase